MGIEVTNVQALMVKGIVPQSIDLKCKFWIISKDKKTEINELERYIPKL